MRILILSQVYWPDSASTAQHLADLGGALAGQGHEVRVLASRHAYEDPSRVFPPWEKHRGVSIERLRHTGFGKGAVWRRLLDFGTFNLALLWRLLWLRREDAEVVLGLTSPPLISFLGVWIGRWKGWRFCYWAMDLQPELAIAAGMLARGSLAARALEQLSTSVFRQADRIVALDAYMAGYIRARGTRPDALTVLPVWPVMQEGWSGPRLENPFRVSAGLGDRFVIMYSGNHAVVHPLDTLLEAARRLRDDDRFLFVFIGGGVRVADVTRFRERYALSNVRQLPYQPREMIHQSLAAADLHVVVLGDGQVGFTHPNKVYGAMFLARPFLYLGPRPSHVTDLIEACPGNFWASHGDPAALVEALRAFHAAGPAHWEAIGRLNAAHARAHFSPAALTQQMCDLVVGTGERTAEIGGARTEAEALDVPEEKAASQPPA
ncbi:MAG: glycosyltransferase family 4 protein [Verrucomicrobiae bacterium]|nr:glycosyltransferase family 4 protein [Verrucomicrobiae bacterium]